ncbi:hypothetical protein PPL_01532 [Heterostelium album PN500]|uniref:Uncharacterized protein n=1 Tax=Heterostelium pallidum (strain ATCC 26659 / Pp 5 / PN500) TaxID=670386 RepID=D3AZR9_HETP5|nr:hypothetical protein PPL_01532 [Heterostelium album PN500]EFA84543.1 hypothetical protein PPL_01532 [Heterostelium album PN500]|eukprot:XP_020436656.1 hypothetical protein PPL_01532 [Heterostelium album PN500]
MCEEINQSETNCDCFPGWCLCVYKNMKTTHQLYTTYRNYDYQHTTNHLEAEETEDFQFPYFEVKDINDIEPKIEEYHRNFEECHIKFENTQSMLKSLQSELDELEDFNLDIFETEDSKTIDVKIIENGSAPNNQSLLSTLAIPEIFQFPFKNDDNEVRCDNEEYRFPFFDDVDELNIKPPCPMIKITTPPQPPRKQEEYLDSMDSGEDLSSLFN